MKMIALNIYKYNTRNILAVGSIIIVCTSHDVPEAKTLVPPVIIKNKNKRNFTS